MLEDTNTQLELSTDAQGTENGSAQSKEEPPVENAITDTMQAIRDELDTLVSKKIGESQKVSISDIMNDEAAINRLTDMTSRKVLQALRDLNTKSAKEMGKPVEEMLEEVKPKERTAANVLVETL